MLARMETVASLQDVRRRRVFYIHGYDPFHPRRYRELYRKEGSAQAAISGYSIDMTPLQSDGVYGWQVASTQDGQTTQTQVEVLDWTDHVQDTMDRSILRTHAAMARTAWIYIASGALRRLMWLRKGPVIAALYPMILLLLQLGLALAAGAMTAALLIAGLNALLGLAGWSLGPLTPLLRWPVLLAVTVAGLRWFKSQDRHILAYYLVQNYNQIARLKGATPPELTARLDAFRARIAAALDSDCDEVLVVGHSSGTHLAVEVLSDLLRRRATPPRPQGPALALLTLGQVIPMISFLPEARKLRADLAFLSARPDITWVDVTAPGDGCSFALCDPVAVSGVAPDDQRWPLVISAAFTRTLSPERWKELRWRFFRLHFQYLAAFDRPGDYDYFRITAGPLSLARRYAGRAPSRSRIDVPASKYTSMAA
jgi:hypothetical protein